VELALGRVKVLTVPLGPVKAVKALPVPPFDAPSVPFTSAVARSTAVEVEPLPTNNELVNVSETWASVRLATMLQVPAVTVATPVEALVLIPVPPYRAPIAVPFQVPVPTVPSVVMLVEPAQVDRAVFSTLARPTLLLASEVIQAGSAYEPEVRTMLAVVIPFTAVPVSEPPEIVPPEIVAPLIVDVQAKAPVALVTVQPVPAEPPASSTLPVDEPPIWTRPVVPALRVRLVAAAVETANEPDEVRIGVVTLVVKLGLLTISTVTVSVAPATAVRLLLAPRAIVIVSVSEIVCGVPVVPARVNPEIPTPSPGQAPHVGAEPVLPSRH
jgi:hypothetical protein